MLEIESFEWKVISVTTPNISLELNSFKIFFNNMCDVDICDSPVKCANNEYGWCNFKPTWLMRFMFVYYLFFFFFRFNFGNIESSLISNFSISLLLHFRVSYILFKQRICLCMSCSSVYYYYSNAGNVRQFTIYENTTRISEECYTMLDTFTYYNSFKIHFAYTTRFTFSIDWFAFPAKWDIGKHLFKFTKY